jgi:hypothetical protein
MIKNFLISLLTILAFAMPSYAAAPSVKKQARDGDTSVDFGMMTVDFVTSNTAGVYSLGFSYPLFSLDWSNGAGGFAAELHVCDTPNGGGGGDLSASGECTLVTALATTDLTVESFKSKKRYIVIEITTAGTGKLTIKGSWDQISNASDTLTGATDGSFISGINGLSSIEWGDGYRDMITASVTSPGWIVGTTFLPYFNTNGVKANCPTATLGADPAKPWFTCPSTGLLKTKTSGIFLDMVNMTPNESWPINLDLYTAGDTDPNGIGITIKASGGSQTVGDEGANGIRLAMNPNWGNAFGTAAIPASTGNFVSIPLEAVSTEDSRYIGIGKPLVFSGSSSAFTRTPAAQPPSTVIVGNVKSGTTKADWTVTTTVNGTGIEADNWCVSHDAYNIASTPGTGTESRYWLKISAIAVDGLSFTTQWWSQGVDQKYPDSHLWSLDPDSLSFAPCYTITGVSQSESTKLVDAVTVYKTSSYSEAGSVGWDVVPYGEFKTTGVKVLLNADINPAGAGAAFTAQNQIDFRGRHQITNAFKIEGASCATDNRATSCLKDGTKGAFAYGLDIAEWGAETGVRYKYYQGGDLGAGNKFAIIDPPTANNDWGTPYVGIPVIGVDGAPAKSLIVSSDKGWGVGQQGFNLGHFAVVDGAVSHTNGNMLVWSDAEGAYIESAQPTPPNTSFSNFPEIGDAENVLYGTGPGLTISAWDSSYTATDLVGATYTVSLPEITGATDIHNRVEIWIEPGVTLTVQGHTNDATALSFNLIATGAGTASMTFTAAASNIACKAEVFVRANNAVMTSSTCPTQTLSNP